MPRYTSLRVNPNDLTQTWMYSSYSIWGFLDRYYKEGMDKYVWFIHVLDTEQPSYTVELRRDQNLIMDYLLDGTR